MQIIKIFLVIAFIITVCFSQSININGIVVNEKGVPLKDAIVMLEKHGHKDTTDVYGYFVIKGSVGIETFNSPIHSNKFSAYIKDNSLHINVLKKSILEIKTFDIQGKIISSIRKMVNPGTHFIALPHISSGIYFHKIKTKYNELVLKSNTLGSVSFGNSLPSTNQYSISIAKKSEQYADFDVIKSIKSGYQDYSVTIQNSSLNDVIIKMALETVTDIDGNLYSTIRIGNQVWTVENLRTTKYNDGTRISNISDNKRWAASYSGAYCYYDNDPQYKEKYGVLYNWYTIGTGKLAPEGWHVPTNEEWREMEEYLIDNGYNWDYSRVNCKIARALAAKHDWYSSNKVGSIGDDLRKNNVTGFTALPGGYRDCDGNFDCLREDAVWYTATENNNSNLCAWRYLLRYDRDDAVWNKYYGKDWGYSVRLVKD